MNCRWMGLKRIKSMGHRTGSKNGKQGKKEKKEEQSVPIKNAEFREKTYRKNETRQMQIADERMNENKNEDRRNAEGKWMER